MVRRAAAGLSPFTRASHHLMDRSEERQAVVVEVLSEAAAAKARVYQSTRLNAHLALSTAQDLRMALPLGAPELELEARRQDLEFFRSMGDTALAADCCLDADSLATIDELQRPKGMTRQALDALVDLSGL